VIATWHVLPSKMQLLQDLVKGHNLRFNGNPIPNGNYLSVVVSSEHLPPGAANAFFADWRRFNTPIVEVKSPLWRRIFRQVKGRLLAHLPA